MRLEGKNNCTKKLLLFLILLIMVLQSVLQSTVYAAKPNKNDRIPPSAPSNLSALSITDTTVILSWNASTDNVKVNSYEIYRNNIFIASTINTSYKVSDLTPATTYIFTVKAKDAAANLSKVSNSLTVTTTSTSVTPTLAPTATPVPSLSPTPVITPLPTTTPAPTIAPTPTPATNPAAANSKIVGYYAAWAAYSGYTPDKIDATKLTHINYAFANISSDLKISLGYPDVDAANIAKLNALKQINPNLKTIIAVGGWSWSGRFSDVALTDESRTIFADSCIEFLVKYGFDGIDIDWEYPVAGGLTTNTRRSEDKYNFTLLMQKLREKLDAQGAKDGKDYILSFAGAAGSWYINNIEPLKLMPYIDYVNVMTYDIHGTWDIYTDFNAPLYDNSDASPQSKGSVDSGIDAYLKAGFSSDKLVMGVPFYGYIFKAVNNVNNGLYQTYSGSSSISYANIAANYLKAAGYTRYFHTQSLVPWLFNGSTFITYEDDISMRYKADYIKSKGLAGAMIWELSQDPDRVLLNALYNNLK